MTTHEEADAIRLSPTDSVATVLRAVGAGERIRVQCGDGMELLEAREPIPLCHKISVVAVARSEPVLKFGEVIGVATAAIAVGAHVHVHNIASGRGRGRA